MKENKYLLTKQGLQKLKKELHDRLTNVRNYIADKIEEATRHGDLSENAMYSAALEDQQMNESKIVEITDIIQKAVVKGSTGKNGKVELGETVEVLEIESSKKYKYQLVGEHEADPLENKISISSPLGNQLMNSKIGETIEVVVSAGVKKYKVLQIL
jgi:transcription elongation factor GreA